MKVISPLDGGGQEVILTLIQGGCNFILRPTLLILEPPLQIIIAQSLRESAREKQKDFMLVARYVKDGGTIFNGHKGYLVCQK